MDINGIAKLAGVSRATVSRYLNDGYVSKEKRARIAKVIEETGYVPSRQARQLRTGKTGLVAVIIPKVYSQSVSRMVEGITETLGEAGYEVILANTNNDEKSEVRYLDLFSGRNRIDGIILIATIVTEEHLRAIGSLKVPIVILGQRIEGQDCVYNDDYHATHAITRSVLRTSRRPAFIGVTLRDEAAGRMRRQGFLDACAEAGIEVAPQATVEADFTVESGYLACEALLDAVPDADTIVCATDDIAYGALTCVREYGHAVPDDIQVTGVGDSELSRILMPSLTTAHLFFKTSGIEAARMLLSELSGDVGASPRELMMGYEVHARSSTR